jgi:hypothetical protein
MAGLIRLILIILVIYYGYKLIIQPFLKILLQTIFKKVIEDQLKNQNKGNGRQNSRQEGNVYVDYIPEKEKDKPKKGNSEGEYVNYEEVK